MNKENMTVDEKFLSELSKHMNDSDELSLEVIYSLFPEMKRKTISWRLYSLVQQGKLYKTGHGIYSLNRNNEDNVSADYEYLQRKSKEIYDILTEYGYDFYITGMDSLIGEILHMPENYPVLIIVEESGIKEIQEVLHEKDMIVLTEKDRDITEKTILKNKVDVILLKGKKLGDKIILKGGAATQLYVPVTSQRTSIDIDMICLASRDEVHQIISEIENKFAGVEDYCKFRLYAPKNPKLGLDAMETYFQTVPSICNEQELFATKGKQEEKIEFIFSQDEYEINKIKQPELFALETEKNSMF